jgi:hypothetical protein
MALIEIQASSFQTAGVVFGAVWAMFEAVEQASSTEARALTTRYLKETDLGSIAGWFPVASRDIFESIFGARHFTRHCVLRSLLASVIAVSILLGNLALHQNSLDWLIFERTLPRIGPILASVIVWSMVLDYLNLLKTRIVIGHLGRHRVHGAALLLIPIVDFGVGFLVFVVGSKLPRYY